MELRINGEKVPLYSEIQLNLKYDCISDTFSAKVYFDPNNAKHKKWFRPGTYQTCTIYESGVLLLTGTILSHKFASAGDPPQQLVNISGYSLTGILEDCTVGIFVDATGEPGTKDSPTPNQFDKMNLFDIATTICKVFPLKVLMDKELQNDPRLKTAFEHSLIKQDEKIGDFLDELCTQKNVVLSHDNMGNLVITRAKAGALLTTSTTLVNVQTTAVATELQGAPASRAQVSTTKSTSRAVLFDFSDKGTWVNMTHSFDGQKLHHAVQTVGEKDGKNALDSTALNPYVNDMSTGLFKAGLRFRRVIQTSGDDDDSKDTARAVVGGELKNIVITVTIQGVTLNGHVVTPNQIVTITNPDCYIYSKTKFFIQEVTLFSDEKTDTATLTCVLPDCFTEDDINGTFV